MNKSIRFFWPFLLVPVWLLAAPLPEPAEALSPPVLQERVEPRFPHELYRLGITRGQATILCEIRREGAVVDWIPLWATHDAFMNALAKVVDDWRFKPAERNGEPVPVNLRLDVRFEVGKSVLSINAIDYAQIVLAQMKNGGLGTSYVFPASALDRAPRPVHTVAPRVYADIPPEERAGEVVVTFFIDREGRVRMPVLTELKGAPLLAVSALEAIEQWRFNPPTIGGRPVFTKAVQRFDFVPDR